MKIFFLILVLSLSSLGAGAYFFIITEIFDRDGISPQEGISVIHSENISLSNLVFDLHITDKPQTLFFSYDLELENTDSGFMAFVMPYSGQLSSVVTEQRHCWTSKPFEDASQRLIFREFPCSEYEESEYYKKNEFHQEWSYKIDNEIDSVDAFSHKVSLKFFPEPNNQDIIKFVTERFPDNLDYNWLDDTNFPKAKITVSDFFEQRTSIPETESGAFRDDDDKITNDVTYSWNISKDNSLFMLEFSTNKELWQTKYRTLLAPILFSTGMSLLVVIVGHQLTVERNRHKAKKLVNMDFIFIHNRLLEKISTLRSELHLLNQNNGLVNDLVNQNKSPYDIMLKFVSGLFFRNWNTVLPWLSDLPIKENEILNQLHDFIDNSNSIRELDISPIIEQLITIINDSTLNDVQKRNEIYNFMRSKLLRYLEVNDTIYHRIHNELREINWINLPDEHFK